MLPALLLTFPKLRKAILPIITKAPGYQTENNWDAEHQDDESTNSSDFREYVIDESKLVLLETPESANYYGQYFYSQRK